MRPGLSFREIYILTSPERMSGPADGLDGAQPNANFRESTHWELAPTTELSSAPPLHAGTSKSYVAWPQPHIV